MALIVLTFLQLLIHRDSIIEYETFPLPERSFLFDLFEVSKDTALQMIYLVEAQRLQIGCGFFTADSTGTEHGNFLVFFRVEVCLCVIREFAERRGVRIDRVLECTNPYFVLITGVDQGDLGV